MWVKITEIFVFCILLLLNNITHVSCHLPSYMSTPSNKVEQYCLQSESCIHDTIQICGKMGDEKRTFLDLCDLLEYACDTNQSRWNPLYSESTESVEVAVLGGGLCPAVDFFRLKFYTHVDDMEDCPLAKEPH